MRSRRVWGPCLLLVGFSLVLNGPALAQKKKPKDDAPAKPAVDSGKLAAGEYVGVLKSLPGTDRLFTLEFESKQLVATGKGGNGNNGLQEQARLLRAQNQLAVAHSPQQRQQASHQLFQAQRQLNQAIARGGVPGGYKVTVVKQEVEFQLSEKAKVRTKLLPEQFDDKGNVKKYTAQELAKLKGKDSKLPGYESSTDKLEVGQKVKLTLAAGKKPEAGKEKDKDDEKKDKAMQVRLVVVEAAGDPNVAAPRGKGKKK